MGFWIGESFEYIGRLNMQQLHSYTGFFVKWIRRGSEYALISEKKCEYTRVLYMSDLHKVLNKIFHDRSLTVLCQLFIYARVTDDSG